LSNLSNRSKTSLIPSIIPQQLPKDRVAPNQLINKAGKLQPKAATKR